MKLLIKLVAAGLFCLGLYLTLAPVPIEPEAWDAPIDAGYVGDFTSNTNLANLDKIALPEGKYGPEDVVVWGEDIYVSSQNGIILKLNKTTQTFSEFAHTGGKPLGMEVFKDRLFVADAYKGLLEVGPTGDVFTLTNQISGQPILYADDLDITDEGIIYFSDASTKFGAEKAGSTLKASLLEIMEHGETGRVLSYDLQTKETALFADGFSFANGVAIAPDGRSIWLVETGKYRIIEISPDGKRRVVIDNLPGFPDNINRGPEGTYFVGLVSKRSKPMDKLSKNPFMRKLIWRLPEFMKPTAESYGFIIQLGADGSVIQTWQDASGAYPTTTGAVVIEGRLYVSSLTAKTLAYRAYP